MSLEPSDAMAILVITVGVSAHFAQWGFRQKAFLVARLRAGASILIPLVVAGLGWLLFAEVLVSSMTVLLGEAPWQRAVAWGFSAFITLFACCWIYLKDHPENAS